MLSVDNGPVLPMAGRAGGQPRTVECASRRSAARRVQAIHRCNCTVLGWTWHFVGAKKDGGMGWDQSRFDGHAMGRSSSKLRFDRGHTSLCWATPPLRPANAPKKNLLQRLRRGFGALEERWKRPARALNPGTRGCLAAVETVERVGAK